MQSTGQHMNIHPERVRSTLYEVERDGWKVVRKGKCSGLPGSPRCASHVETSTRFEMEQSQVSLRPKTVHVCARSYFFDVNVRPPQTCDKRGWDSRQTPP